MKLKSTSLQLILFYFLLVISIATFIFYSGFFSIRYEIKEHSRCDQTSFIQNDYGRHKRDHSLVENRKENLFYPGGGSLDKNLGNSDGGCWMPGIFKKSLVLVVDALRFDFVAHQDPSSSGFNLNYHNRLTEIHNLVNNQSENTLFYQFISDPPTVTIPRLKSIATGLLPTFIDVSNNFGGKKVSEDNFVRQLIFQDTPLETEETKEKDHHHRRYSHSRRDEELRKKVLFTGDGSWVELFPHHFYAEHKYSSFSVHDLDTVDNGVEADINCYLNGTTGFSDDTRDVSDWDIIIGHILGVDHAGHHRGLNHPSMAKKLDDLNALVKKLIDKIDDDTLFIMMSDHGQTATGDHGSTSFEEISSTLFMYSKSTKLNNSIPMDLFNSKSEQFGTGIRTIDQIDFTSTYSLLMGVPIPFGNLGSVIPEIFLSTGGWRQLLDAKRLTSWQTQRYLNTYSRISSDFYTPHFITMLENADLEYFNLGDNPSDAQVQRVYQMYDEIYLKSREFVFSKWSNFDLNTMALGILTYFMAIFTLIFIIYHLLLDNTPSSQDSLYAIFTSIKNTKSLRISCGLTVVILFLCFKPSVKLLLGTISILSNVVIINYLCQSKCCISPSNSMEVKPTPTLGKDPFSILIIPNRLFVNCLTVLMILVVLAYGLSMSNDTLELESYHVSWILLIIVVGITIVTTFLAKKSLWSKRDTVDCLVLIAAHLFTLESVRHITATYDLSKPIQDLKTLNLDSLALLLWNGVFEYLYLMPFFYIFYLYIHKYMWNTPMNSSDSTTTKVTLSKRDISRSKWLVVTILLGISVYWYIQSTTFLTHYSSVSKNFSAWVAYTCIAIGMIKSFFLKFNYQHLTYNSILMKVLKLKSTVYKMIEFNTFLFLLTVLILGPDNVSDSVWFIVQVAITTRLLSQLWIHRKHLNYQDITSTGSQPIYFNRQPDVVFWIHFTMNFTMITIHHFYSSGHDCGFNNIQFGSAFVGFDSYIMWRAGLMVIINTFSSFIVVPLLLPTVIIITKYLYISNNITHIENNTTSISISISSDDHPFDQFNSNNNQLQQQQGGGDSREMSDISSDSDSDDFQTPSSTIKYIFKDMNFNILYDIKIGSLLYLLVLMVGLFYICFYDYKLRNHFMIARVYAPKFIFLSLQYFIAHVILLVTSFIVSKTFKIKSYKSIE
ncbi:phosphatidylinositol glycan [Tieghemostelium lacteum]|uniref:Phosphatidylinositol glycan n=1 Tax=Tieghemostelium lacteum TaxID=361077 RepID=A0A152A0J6_TIELA|nr:phosphatidylinositol glycan [Tieghemostelium lacteum]|eukprot:KYQ99728.1 phosphatidylinositol glycan [Tieghemostelium lacteum]